MQADDVLAKDVFVYPMPRVDVPDLRAIVEHIIWRR